MFFMIDILNSYEFHDFYHVPGFLATAGKSGIHLSTVLCEQTRNHASGVATIWNPDYYIRSGEKRNSSGAKDVSK